MLINKTSMIPYKGRNRYNNENGRTSSGGGFGASTANITVQGNTNQQQPINLILRGAVNGTARGTDTIVVNTTTPYQNVKYYEMTDQEYTFQEIYEEWDKGTVIFLETNGKTFIANRFSVISEQIDFTSIYDRNAISTIYATTDSDSGLLDFSSENIVRIEKPAMKQWLFDDLSMYSEMLEEIQAGYILYTVDDEYRIYYLQSTERSRDFGYDAINFTCLTMDGIRYIAVEPDGNVHYGIKEF